MREIEKKKKIKQNTTKQKEKENGISLKKERNEREQFSLVKRMKCVKILRIECRFQNLKKKSQKPTNKRRSLNIECEQPF